MMAVDLSALKFVTGKANDGGLLGKGGVVGESAGCQLTMSCSDSAPSFDAKKTYAPASFQSSLEDAGMTASDGLRGRKEKLWLDLKDPRWW